jgi:hypothetical protein
VRIQAETGKPRDALQTITTQLREPDPSTSSHPEFRWLLLTHT